MINFSKGKNILIVDDDAITITILRNILEGEGYTIFDAKTGGEALKTIENIRPDLIILDFMLPDIKGFDVLKYLKAHPLYLGIPVIMLTSNNDELDTVLSLEFGADDYVLKPYRKRELLARIKAVQRRRKECENKNNNTIAFDDIVIDVDSRIVRKSNKILDMTVKEFDLLVTLASNPYVTFTREKLLDKIWDQESLLGTRTVDVHISMLRKKIESQGIKRIDTVKGLGYKFIL